MKSNFWNELEKEFYIDGSYYQKKIEKGEEIPQFSSEYLITAIYSLREKYIKRYEKK